VHRIYDLTVVMAPTTDVLVDLVGTLTGRQLS
jgi:hypothetical protein